MPKSLLLAVVSVLPACVIPAAPAQADVTSPTGLNPGDEYRLAFVTSSDFRITGLSTDVADYNQLASNAANSQTGLANLNTNWFAIVSTPGDGGVDAKINTGTDDSPAGDNGVPIFLVDGDTKIADHYDDLWDSSIDRRLDITETGATATGSGANDFTVWTGTLGDGTVNPAQPLGGSGLFTGRGQWGETDTRWIAGFGGNASNELSIYAISGVLTVSGGEVFGDYNDSGLVEQGDLNQVLNNWGQAFDQVAATWINQRPTEGIVDQAELNVVLNNWGSDAAPEFSGNAVPEPASLTILGVASFLGRRCRP